MVDSRPGLLYNKLDGYGSFFMVKTRISVRNLVEFILRCGDIDNRTGADSAEAMQEGARLHRQIQRRAGADYKPEVSLSFDYVEDDVEISVEGRADGVIENDTGVTVDEIKTTYGDVMKYTEAKPLHLAQAKFYAHILAQSGDLPSVKVRLTYVNIDTEEIRYFNYTFLQEELAEFVTSVCHEYVKWARFSNDWVQARNASIQGLPFPFPYREGQEELVKQVYYTIYRKKKLFLEAPTGVGKTIATLYPSVQAMGQGLFEKLFYLTAKTITRTVAEDTVSIMRKDGLRFKNITLTAKEKICFTTEHECNPEACPYAKGHFDRVNDCIFDLISSEDAITADKICEYARRYEVCPFEMSLDVSLFTDVIICDYNYAFDPRARLQRYFADETNAGKYQFLVDEAHNLVDRAREMYSAMMVKEAIMALKRATEEELPLISKKLEKCNKELLALKRECDNYLINPPIDGFVQALMRAYSEIEKFLKDDRRPKDKPKVSKEVKDEVLLFYFEASHFLKVYELVDENYSVYCTYTEDDHFYLKLFCVNPRRNLSECMAMARSSVLFSATLLPVQYYKNLLAGEADDYEVYAKSVFDPSRRGLFIARDVTSKYTRRNDDEYTKIAYYIRNTVAARRGNYLVFFPSYQFLEKVADAYDYEFCDETDTELIIQRGSMKEEEKSAFLRRFEGVKDDDDVFDGIDAEIDFDIEDSGREEQSLIGFCVMGGIFSEGIDLTHESLIGAIIVGTGLPQVCLERDIMKQTFEAEGEDGFDYAYRYPGMNKVLQAAGRVIRTETDLGVVVLLDERFLQRNYTRLFPTEWSDYRVVNIDSLYEEVEEFWDEHME